MERLSPKSIKHDRAVWLRRACHLSDWHLTLALRICHRLHPRGRYSNVLCAGLALTLRLNLQLFRWPTTWPCRSLVMIVPLEDGRMAAASGSAPPSTRQILGYSPFELVYADVQPGWARAPGLGLMAIPAVLLMTVTLTLCCGAFPPAPLKWATENEQADLGHPGTKKVQENADPTENF